MRSNKIMVIGDIDAGTGKHDKWGISKLRLDKSTGTKWYSNWDNGVARTISSAGLTVRNQDPQDAMVSFHCQSYTAETPQGNQVNRMVVDGAGICTLSGMHPRIYINKTSWPALWTNTESTVYSKVVSCMIVTDSYTPIRLATRSNHQNEYRCVCDGKGYGHEVFVVQETLLLKDARFGKELLHPHYAHSNTSPPKPTDMSTWIGHKFICRTLSDGSVSLKSYMDTTGGANGGTWVLIGDLKDTGKNFAINEQKELANITTDCKKCSNNSKCKDRAPKSPWTEKITRRGASSYLRADFVTNCQFKYYSVREIV